MPTIAAMSYKFSIGQPFMYPRNDLDYSANFLHMMFGNPCEPSVISPTIARAMDRIFLLHADHEQKRVYVDSSPSWLVTGQPIRPVSQQVSLRSGARRMAELMKP